MAVTSDFPLNAYSALHEKRTTAAVPGFSLRVELARAMQGSGPTFRTQLCLLYLSLCGGHAVEA